jgi:hypothetical protein
MKLSEAITHKGAPFLIPDCDRYDLPSFFVEQGYKVGAEIGVYKAEFTDLFCKAGLKMFAIDPYKAYGDYATSPKYNRFQERQDFLYGHAHRVLDPYGEQATMIRKTSMEAVEDFKDNSLDFVYIDGHHGFKYIAEDLWEWSKKVRKGGIISGHDYGDYLMSAMDPYVIHVRYVVDAFTTAMLIKNWYVLGSQDKVPGTKRENWRSFMWIKG